MQVLESVCESVCSVVREEVPQADLYSRRILQRFTMATALPQRFADSIGLVVLIGKLIHFGVRHLLNGIGEISHTVSIDGIAELDFSADLVALRDRDIAHVVAKADDLQSLRIVPRTGSTEPCTGLRLHLSILPEADNDLAFQTHAGPDEAELPIAMSGLVQIHEVHAIRATHFPELLASRHSC